MGDVDRVRWRCRRGLLELDLILNGFLDTRYGRLDADQRRQFNELLEEADNDLLDLVMGKSEAPDAALGELVQKLRAA